MATFPYNRPITYILWCALAAICLVSCSGGASKKECESLFHKLIDLEIGDKRELPTAMKKDLKEQRRQIAQYSQASFLEACTKNTPRDVVLCSLKANSMADIAICDGVQSK